MSNCNTSVNATAHRPPPSVAAIAGVGHAMWLLVAWGYWLDRHRVAAADAPPSISAAA